MEITLDIKTAPVFAPLLNPARYRAAYGGRGSGKSRFFAGLMVEMHATQAGRRSVCIREVQKTLKESAKRLIEDEISRQGLGEAHGFRLLNDEIRTPGGGTISFIGMQDHNAESVKSLEGYDCAWIEEAQTLSARSLQLLRPTIRAPGSEIWASWNPTRKTDPIDVFLRGPSAPTNAVVVRANWDNNPWLPTELNQERLDDLINSPDQYAHVWDGDYVTVATGAYYADALTRARAEHRIGLVAADPLMTLRAFFDIGGTGAKSDACSIWIVQIVGREVRVLDYYEAVGQPLEAHINWMQSQGYLQHRCHVYLPHDGVTHDRVFDVTYESEIRRAGYDVTVVKNQGAGAATQRIEALRKLFPSIRFDENKCAAGLEAIGWYHEKRDDKRGIGLGPDHDWSSHAADALGLMAVKADDIFDDAGARRTNHYAHGVNSWMG